MKFNVPLYALSVSAFVCLGSPALAQERHEYGGREPSADRVMGLRLDHRYHHDHYYPPRGHAFAALPGGSVSAAFGGNQYFFHGGVWFRPVGGRFVVVAAPIGIAVPVLPPSYVTLSIGGAPYYYANDVYYTSAPGGGYTVVAPPPGAESAQPTAPPATISAPIVYPRNGQTAAQTEDDRQACGRWASAQPGATTDGQVFDRAMDACMDGRGYTVR